MSYSLNYFERIFVKIFRHASVECSFLQIFYKKRGIHVYNMPRTCILCYYMTFFLSFSEKQRI
jgi:hypothetical protein